MLDQTAVNVKVLHEHGLECGKDEHIRLNIDLPVSLTWWLVVRACSRLLIAFQLSH